MTKTNEKHPTETILGCPFCGNAPTAELADDYSIIKCESDDCGVSPWIETDDDRTVADIVKDWNTRAR